MREEMLDKDVTLGLAERTTAMARSLDPRVMLGRFLLARSTAAERRTQDGPPTTGGRALVPSA